MNSENYHLKAFSPDKKLFAIIQSDGKLKIWDVEKSELKQEYVPNLHLSTPCTALSWIKLATKQKKKSKSSDGGGTLHVILGTSRGGLALYSYATAKIETNFTGTGHSASVTSIDHDNKDFIYTTGLDCKVIKWNIKQCAQESSFDCGPEKPTSICLLSEDRLAIAAKSIKVFEQNSTLVSTCTGHSSNVLLMKSFEYDDESYIISASKNDRNLSLWKIEEDQKKSSAVANFTLLNNSPSSVDYTLDGDLLQITCVCRTDSMSYFSINISSFKSRKPVKSKFTLEIASEDEKIVNHIPLTAVAIASDEHLMIGYGDFLLKFELVPIKQEQKNVILVRRDPMKLQIVKKSRDGESDVSALVTPIISSNVEVLNVISATRKAQKPVEIPLETRLDNLTVGEGRKPNAKKMTHQLIQGLHGKDASILRTVLRQRDEETVRLTVKYLPSQYVIALVDELSLLMTKRTAGSEVALIWLRYLIQSHSSSLMAYGIENLNATFGTTLGIIDHRAENFPKLQRLRGRLELLVRQIKRNDDVNDEMKMDNLLVYEDSDDDSDELDGKSDSSEDDIFDEFEDDEEQNGKNGNVKMDEDDEDDEEMECSDSD